MAQVEFKQVKKSYGNVDVIHGVDLTIADGEFVAVSYTHLDVYKRQAE